MFARTAARSCSKIGDPSLKKERLNQLDAGLRWDYDYLKAGVNGFYAWIQDYITYDANKLSSTNGLSQVVFTNTNLWSKLVTKLNTALS